MGLIGRNDIKRLDLGHAINSFSETICIRFVSGVPLAALSFIRQEIKLYKSGFAISLVGLFL